MERCIRTLPRRWWPALLLATACAAHAPVAPEQPRPEPVPGVARPIAEAPAPSTQVAAHQVPQRPPTVLGPIAEARPGFLANRTDPANPIDDIVVAGFSDQATAAAFVASSFVARETPPVFQQKLARGQSVRFADAASPFGAAFLVVYYFDERGRPTLLSLIKAHPDIPLAIGSIGYQLLLDVDREQSLPEPLLDRPLR